MWHVACACRMCTQHVHGVFSTPFVRTACSAPLVCARHVHVQAWSPLGNGRLTRFLRDSADAKQACADVGARHGKTAYQVASRWTPTRFAPTYCVHHLLYPQVALRWITQSGASFTVEARSAAHFTAERQADGALFYPLRSATARCRWLPMPMPNLCLPLAAYAWLKYDYPVASPPPGRSQRTHGRSTWPRSQLAPTWISFCCFGFDYPGESRALRFRARRRRYGQA